jgi:hypothetical protein
LAYLKVPASLLYHDDRLRSVHSGRLPRITQRAFSTGCAKRGTNGGRSEKIARGDSREPPAFMLSGQVRDMDKYRGILKARAKAAPLEAFSQLRLHHPWR